MNSFILFDGSVRPEQLDLGFPEVNLLSKWFLLRQTDEALMMPVGSDMGIPAVA